MSRWGHQEPERKLEAMRTWSRKQRPAAPIPDREFVDFRQHSIWCARLHSEPAAWFDGPRIRQLPVLAASAGCLVGTLGNNHHGGCRNNVGKSNTGHCDRTAGALCASGLSNGGCACRRRGLCWHIGKMLLLEKSLDLCLSLHVLLQKEAPLPIDMRGRTGRKAEKPVFGAQREPNRVSCVMVVQVPEAAERSAVLPDVGPAIWELGLLQPVDLSKPAGRRHQRCFILAGQTSQRLPQMRNTPACSLPTFGREGTALTCSRTGAW
mmetsp:Transcript_94253/g.270270  ORF Transcript_94253/g.270270 Transcript_94253/m.270270 type:complete len:265 (+) Transcript_94253:452-1246(+)